LICGLALAVFIAACTGTDAGDGADDAASQERDTQEASAPKLDLDTLRADTPAGTIQAEAWENTYVGAVDEDLFIGVSLSKGINAGKPQDVTVYLCDREEIGGSLTGEVGTETTALEVEDASVELSLADDAVSGAVTVGDGQPQPFTADEASGDAGLYMAEATFDDTDYWAGWVVLPDGSQRGALREDDEQQDITYLANKIGWDARMVAMSALAGQFGEHGGV
jgi:hypothetical protein